jgi:hypothetical protein
MPSYEDALREAERLSKLSDERLLEELGARVGDSALPGGDQRAQEFSGDFAADVKDMGAATEFLRRVGRAWWKKLEPQLMRILCDPGNEDLKKITNNSSIAQVSAGLATAAVIAVIAAPPAWLIVATTILATKLTETGLQALCEAWAESNSEA